MLKSFLAKVQNKRRNVTAAEKSLARSQTIWMMDTMHDIPLHKPVELAEAIKTWQVFTR